MNAIQQGLFSCPFFSLSYELAPIMLVSYLMCLSSDINSVMGLGVKWNQMNRDSNKMD